MCIAGVAGAAQPAPGEVEVIDVPNDGGSALGVLWNWVGAVAEGTRIVIEVEVNQNLLEKFKLSEWERDRLDSFLADLRSELAPILPEKVRSKEESDEARDLFQDAERDKAANTAQLRKDYWKKKIEAEMWEGRRDKAWERFNSRVTVGGVNLFEKSNTYNYLEGDLQHTRWLPSDVIQLASDVKPKGEFPGRFGLNPPEGDKLYVEVNQVRALQPSLFSGVDDSAWAEEIDHRLNPFIIIDLEAGDIYNLRLLVIEGLPKTADLKSEHIPALHGGEIEGATLGIFELGGGTPRVSLFNSSKWNNLIFAVVFAIIILIGIVIARRNPNIFIRRIQGLEAVDEAIGRATEMGKPVLYLCGLDPLSSLSTIAAVNILGQVARRIAEYDSDLIVPCRDPVVLTVAQETVKEAYIDGGRPDAYREDNIFFITDDQFSYTAATCGIMMREKPAANFFMGHYYAESLLLAETGASTGAIQIAGTDALHQLPFFITTCDYTLIGEELYAASAYLSREPMLLGSLKGQDLGKAVVIVLIILQTILFIFNPDWDWLRSLVVPL